MIIQELKPSKRVRGRWLAVLDAKTRAACETQAWLLLPMHR